MKTLIMMVGAPGSGKTTFIKNFMSKITDKHISRDVIRYNIISDEDDYFAKENEVFDEFIRQIDEALLTTQRYVYADATHLNEASRAKVLNRLKNVETLYAICMNVSLADTLERNGQREGRALVPDSVVRNMFYKITLPTKEEGFEHVFTVDKDMHITAVKEENNDLVY